MYARLPKVKSGYLTTHGRFLLVLLRSRPDTVRGFPLHKTRSHTKGLLHTPFTGQNNKYVVYNNGFLQIFQVSDSLMYYQILKAETVNVFIYDFIQTFPEINSSAGISHPSPILTPKPIYCSTECSKCSKSCCGLINAQTAQQRVLIVCR